MRRLANALLQSIRKAIQGNPRLQCHIASHPRFWGWLGKRFSSEPFGLRLTVGAAFASAFLFFFLSVVQDLIANEAVVLADLRLLSLVQMYRTPGLSRGMLFLTYLGNWQVVTAGASLLVLYLALTRRWLWILALLVSIGGGEILVQLGKVGFGRPRPDLVNALIPAQGPSFPSGHAFVAICFYGLVGWFAIDQVKTWKAMAAIAAMTIATVLAIGFSRIYLGVHWPSDVIASFGPPKSRLTARQRLRPGRRGAWNCFWNAAAPDRGIATLAAGSHGLNVPVPDHTTLSRRAQKWEPSARRNQPLPDGPLHVRLTSSQPTGPMMASQPIR